MTNDKAALVQVCCIQVWKALTIQCVLGWLAVLSRHARLFTHEPLTLVKQKHRMHRTGPDFNVTGDKTTNKGKLQKFFLAIANAAEPRSAN